MGKMILRRLGLSVILPVTIRHYPPLQQETARCEFWKRRSAAALIEQLPDDLDEAVEILEIARRLLTVPLSD